MSSIGMVLGFSWNYVRRYWVRLAASILLGIVFALANVSFIWAARTLVGRWDPRENTAVKPAEETASKLPQGLVRLRQKAEEFGQDLERRIDPWLPRAKQPLDWRQILGILLFLPTLVAFGRRPIT